MVELPTADRRVPSSNLGAPYIMYFKDGKIYEDNSEVFY